MIQSQLPPAIRENPFRISRLNHSSDFRGDWDVESLNSAQSNWVLAEIELIAGRTRPDPGQLIPIFLSQPGYGKTHIFGRLAAKLKESAFFVFVGAIPDTRRIAEHLRWTVVETLFRGENGRPSPLEEALAELLLPSLITHADRCNLNHDKQQLLISILHSPVEGTLEILGRSTHVASYHKLAASVSSRMPQVRASIVRAMVLALSPEKHLARQWLRGEKLAEDESRRIGIHDDSPNVMDVLNAFAAILEYRKPMVICFDQIESVLKDADGPRLLGTHLMELLAGVANQYLIVSCFAQAWYGNYSKLLPEAFLRRSKELELNFPAPEHALALVKKRLQTWPGYDLKQNRSEYFPFDSEKLERFAREEKPKPSELIQLCEAAMDGWMSGRLKAPLVVSGHAPSEEPVAQLFHKRWIEELASVQSDPKRQTEEMSDARIFAAMKEIIAMVKAAGRRWPGLQITVMKEPVLPSTASYPRYGMRLEIDDGASKHSVTAGVTTMTGGNGLFYYVREFIKTIKTSRGGVLLNPRHEFNLGQVGSTQVKKAREAGKLEILSLKDHRGMFAAMECALGLFEQAQTGNLVLGTQTIGYEQCQELLRESRVLEELAFLQKIAKWNPPTQAVNKPLNAVSAPAAVAARNGLEEESEPELAAI
ncbi:MAG TPA: hypothetical protein VFE47_28030 [Tepidisphaeraceae bacterium]|jgi:hypothetical protein|nr:hypothetical protein [Tepidisphaeraceae bacterium]